MGRPGGDPSTDPGLPVDGDTHVHVNRPVSFLGQGKSLRFAVGYLYIAVGLTLLLLVVAYMVGYRLGFQGGEQKERAKYENLSSQNNGSAPIDDPLTEEGRVTNRENASLRAAQGFPGGSGPAAGGSDQPQRESSAIPDPTPTGHPAGAGFGPIDADPRQEGYFYFVLMETTVDGALRLARFCREHGLEAYVIASHNARNRRVIVVPGLTSRSSSDPAYRRLREQIRTVGRSWQAENPRESDLSDAYPIPAGG
jgi:hypothetical protein